MMSTVTTLAPISRIPIPKTYVLVVVGGFFLAVWFVSEYHTDCVVPNKNRIAATRQSSAIGKMDAKGT
jgi:hypothetical protein